jgi:membrane protein implicated in regulation of membrane protease activity
MKQDIISALKAMGENAAFLLKEFFLIVFRVSLALAIFSIVVFIIVNYFLAMLGLAAIGFLVAWFYVEYQNAKSIREYEELIKQNETN